MYINVERDKVALCKHTVARRHGFEPGHWGFYFQDGTGHDRPREGPTNGSSPHQRKLHGKISKFDF